MSKHENLDRLYDELLGHGEKTPQSNEYNPDDPLGLSSGRMSCTMATRIDPLAEEMAEVFVQDENGKWIQDEKSRGRRDMLIRSYRKWL